MVAPLPVIRKRRANGRRPTVTEPQSDLRRKVNKDELHTEWRAARVLEAHERVRQASRVKGIRHRVEPKLPVDVLGVYVCLPAGE